MEYETGMANRRSFREIFPVLATVALAVLLVLLLSFIDILTGEISFSIFYLLPIYLVTWRLGRWPGFAFSLFSAIAWLIADNIEDYTFTLVHYWNALVRLAFFLLTVYLVSALKITEQRRRALEKIFYHDILNVAGSIRGFAELLQAHPDIDKKEIYHWLQAAAEQSIDQIETQRAIAAAEHDELPVEPTLLNSLEIISQTVQFYQYHPEGKNRHIRIAPDAEGINFTGDQTLVNRILGNMVKNALEASRSGGPVTIGCSPVDGGVEFRVHNAGDIPMGVREQIFTKSVSTKGSGRGLGTYSIHVLSRYLKGKASFSSSEEEGTTFRVWFPGEYKKNG
jgi:signal transduction histidine kinase